MKMHGRWSRGGLLVSALSAGFLIVLAAKAGDFLVVDAPVHSDVILVLAGETDRRPQRALELLAQGYGQRVVLDVPANAKIYEFTQIQLAQKYIQDLHVQALNIQASLQAPLISICPIDGLSTKDESRDAEKCLASEGSKSVLIVTSDFHTRRALSIFRREVAGHDYSVAAAHDEAQFGVNWWTHRQWAKTLLDEWLRLVWWKTVDQWR
jgi:DUF218 domain